MLSTNLHNPSVRKADKMELHQFIQQLRGQNNGVRPEGGLKPSVVRPIASHPLASHIVPTIESRAMRGVTMVPHQTAFPGDYLERIYKTIRAEELKVRTTA